jgi:TRAP-type C4-dicarboxylate transport system permease small subunit
MRITNLTGALLKGFNSATKFLNWVGYVSLAGLVLITFVDVAGRYLMNKPLMGSLPKLLR